MGLSSTSTAVFPTFFVTLNESFLKVQISTKSVQGNLIFLYHSLQILLVFPLPCSKVTSTLLGIVAVVTTDIVWIISPEKTLESKPPIPEVWLYLEIESLQMVKLI